MVIKKKKAFFSRKILESHSLCLYTRKEFDLTELGDNIPCSVSNRNRNKRKRERDNMIIIKQ